MSNPRFVDIVLRCCQPAPRTEFEHDVLIQDPERRPKYPTLYKFLNNYPYFTDTRTKSKLTICGTISLVRLGDRFAIVFLVFLVLEVILVVNVVIAIVVFIIVISGGAFTARF